MNQTLKTLINFHKGTEVHHLRHRACVLTTYLITLDDFGPWIRRKLLDTQRKLLSYSIDLQHLRLDFLPPTVSLRRPLKAFSPRNVRDMNQSIHAFLHCNEDTELRYITDHTLNHITYLIFILDGLPRISL